MGLVGALSPLSLALGSFGVSETKQAEALAKGNAPAREPEMLLLASACVNLQIGCPAWRSFYEGSYYSPLAHYLGSK